MRPYLLRGLDALLALLYLGLLGSSYQLFLRQAIHYPGRLGVYDSDLPAHISEGINGTAYSLMERSYGFLMETLGLNEKAVALWLALLLGAAVFVTWLLLRQLFPAGNQRALHFLAFACSFVMPLYLPWVNDYRYMGMQSGNLWHNSTYLGMKFAAVLVLLLYFSWLKTYQKGISPGKWLLFTASLVFVNLMKPNFILCFAPAMGLQLLADCILARRKTLKYQILSGIPVLISLGVVIYQTTVLFQGKEDGSRIALMLPYNFLKYNRYPWAALLQSAAFPLFVLAGNRKELKRDRVFGFTWLIWLFGLLEYLFLGEEGPRKTHGNFSWGYSFCIFLVFVVCAAKCCEKLKEGRPSGGRKLYWAAAGLLFLGHLACGMTYFIHLYLGGTYVC
ncbi:MAG TPA: hypothetical protein IAB31_01980 [Candidatus Choladousia intestinavium]|uniref:Uncharacterized protein n=1 Tax=Candidatus Choladousia intestinavium TaxID=2840727 RepID=A0A9D1D7Y1_9FIRM|nr:hypothetical protein [Candidatus Choladousia intestinavium]